MKYKIIETEYWNFQKEKRIKGYIIKKRNFIGWWYYVKIDVPTLSGGIAINIRLFLSPENAQNYIDNEIQSKIKPIYKEIKLFNI